MIMDKGREGLYDLLLRYGLKREAESLYPARQQLRFQVPLLLESLQRIDGFLDMERGDGRPQICAELAKIQLNYLKPPKISTIINLTESVTQGELDWSEYVAAVRPLVRELQEECHE
jgi:hypothetical protein